MKTALTYLLAAALLAGCSRASDPAPTAAQSATSNPAAPWATYRNPAGDTGLLDQAKAYSVTAPALYMRPTRRAVVLQGITPGRVIINISYYYTTGGGVSPFTSTGRLILDAPVAITATPTQGTAQPTEYEIPGGATAYVDFVGPSTVNGVYTGPVAPGGPSVTFTFNHLTF